MARLGRRVTSLEAVWGTWAASSALRNEKRRAVLETWEKLAASMDPRHVDHVLGELSREPTVLEPRSRLAQVVLDMLVWPSPDHLLRLPPEVAEVYLRDRGAHPLDDCGICGYRVPVRPAVMWGGTPPRHEPEIRYFEACPLCGGAVGERAYYRKHGEMP